MKMKQLDSILYHVTPEQKDTLLAKIIAHRDILKHCTDNNLVVIAYFTQIDYYIGKDKAKNNDAYDIVNNAIDNAYKNAMLD